MWAIEASLGPKVA